MPDLDDRLAALARHAERTARLEPAPSIRVRADRRRRRRYVAAAALGVVAAAALGTGTGIVLAQPDRERLPAGSPSLAPSTAPSSAPASPLPIQFFATRAADVAQTGLRPGRAYRIMPAAIDRGAGLALGARARFEVKRTGAIARFSFEVIPGGNREWLIRLADGAGSQCVWVATDAMLNLDQCDPNSSDARFEFRRGDDDAWGRPAYGIVATDQVDWRWLTWDPAADRLTMTAAPNAGVVNGWVFVDDGPAG